MALWHIEVDWRARQVKLTYVDHPGAADAIIENCGRTALHSERDLEAWCIDQAAPLDIINTTRGTFVRQVVPRNLTV